MSELKISIIVPAYNEEGSIKKTISQIADKVSTPHEIIVLNDCSTDMTPEIVSGIELPNLRLLNNERNEGFVKTLLKGFSEAGCDVLLPVMADNCDEYTVIDKMYQLISEGFDMVSGSRYIRGGRRVSQLSMKSFFSRMVGFTTNKITGIPTHDISNSFKMFRKEILSKMTIESLGFEVSVEIAIKAFYLGFKINEIPTIWTDRTADVSKFNNLKQIRRYWKWLKFAIMNRIRDSRRA